MRPLGFARPGAGLLAAILALLVGAAPAAAHRRPVITHVDTAGELGHASVAGAQGRRALTTVRAASVDGAGGLPETWCGSETHADDASDDAFPGQPVIKLVYAYPSDRPDRFPQLADVLQGDVSLLSRFVADESGGRRTVRFDMGTACGPQYVDVQVAALPGSTSAYLSGGTPSLTRVISDVAPLVAGGGAAPRNYLVYADGLQTDSVVGVAQSYIDDSPGAGNVFNQGGLYAAVWGRGSFVPGTSDRYVQPTGMMHELSHTLGAVQNSAPHSTGAGHCWDEWDVVCYRDGGPFNSLVFPCARLVGQPIDESLDCGRDDYFSPDPAPGSYLATHWDMYRSVFLGSCDSLGAACGAGEGAGDAPPASPSPDPASVADPAPVAAVPTAPVRHAAQGVVRRVRGGRAAGARVGVVRLSSVGGSASARAELTLPRGAWSVRTCVTAGARTTCRRWKARLSRATRLLPPAARLALTRVPARASAVARVEIDRRARRWAALDRRVRVALG